MNDNTRPPWIAFPRIPWGSIGWRMGGGENYWHQRTSWFKALSQAARGQYRRDWSEPEGWKGFYEFVEFGLFRLGASNSRSEWKRLRSL